MSVNHYSLVSLQDSVDSLIRDGELDTPLEMVQAFVERIVSDPQAIGRVFSAPVLDEICLRLGEKALSHMNLAARAPGKGRVVYVATEFYRQGGHTLVAADYVRLMPDHEHLFLMTDVLSNPDREAPDLRLKSLGALVEVAPADSKLERLRWLLSRLFELAPERIYWFNHHQDAVAVAAAQAAVPGEKYFIHHADHQLCLGVHARHLRHVDLHNIGFFNCRDVLGIADNLYLPLVCDDLGQRSLERRFVKSGKLRTCSSGSGNKFEVPYLHDYADVIARVLHATGGDHIHIGYLSDEYLERIRRRLAEEKVPQERFVQVLWVPSLWQALIEREVDVYLGSWPIGGAKALIEAMGAGIPSIVHVNYLSRFHSGFDLSPPAAPTWRTPAELVDRLAAFTPDILASQSRVARVHYEMHHAPRILASLLSGDGQNAPKPIPLREYRPDTLQAFLDERAQTNEALASEQRLGEALASANGQVGTLTEDVRAYQRQAEEFDRQLREAHSRMGTAEEDKQRLGEALASANAQVGTLTEDVRAYQRQAEEFDRQLREAHSRMGTAEQDKQRLGEALASANGQVGTLTEAVGAYQQQAEEFDRQLRDAHSRIGTAEQDKQRLGEALASANAQVGTLTEDVRAYQQQAEEFDRQLRKLVERRTLELGSCRFLARQLMLALRRRISTATRQIF